MKHKYSSIIIAALIIMILSMVSAYSADEWGMFRKDAQRTGATDPEVLDSNRMRPIWVYPAPVTPLNPIDDSDPSAFEAKPLGNDDYEWLDSSSIDFTKRAPNAFGNNYKQIVALYSNEPQYENWYKGAAPKPTATWTLDRTASPVNVNYYIEVWFPAASINESPLVRTKDAHYIVEDIEVDAGDNIINRTVLGRFTLDQTNGADWISLGSESFEAPAGHKLVVTLTNETQYQINTPKRIVIADAVRFIQDTGTVLASPVLSQCNENNPILLSSPIYTKPLARVAGQDKSRDIGVINGINTEDIPSTSDDDRGMRSYVFPEKSENWIQNGFTSTPLIMEYNNEEVAAAAAGDGQVYVFRTKANIASGTRQVWQGPGYVINAPTPLPTTGWTKVDNEPGYQGDKFYRAEASASGSNVKWEQTGIAKGKYAILAWIPPSTAANPLYSKVEYTIEGTGIADTTVYVNQRNGGQWARLGIYNIPANGSSVTVTLLNKNAPAAGQPTEYVAANAIKIIPSDLLSFELSSPVKDNNGDIYVGGENGRLYKLRIGQQTPVWVYPDNNQSPSIIDINNPKYPAPNSIGTLYASPTLSADNNTVYIGSMDGYVYAINASDGTRKWRFPDISDNVNNLGEITSTAAVGSHIYVAIGGVSSGYEYDTSGRVVALRDNGNNASVVWWSPASPDTDGNNHGEFMFSSPLLMTRPGDTSPSLYVGSTDGYFYGMNASDGSNLNNTVDTASPWNPTDLIDIIDSSPAGTILPTDYRLIDGTPTTTQIPYAFVGSESRSFYGIDLRNGSKDWFWNLFNYVFASPAVAKERVYTADVSGYTWAFSSRAGSGAGGVEAWNVDTGLAEPPTGGSETGASDQSMIDVDIFSKSAWDSWTPSTEHTGSIQDNEAVYEWGERIYFVVWGIKDESSKIQVSLKSRGRGRASNAGTQPILVPSAEIKPIPLNPDGLCYAKYYYDMDGTSGRAVTPGARVTLSVTESSIVNGTEQQIGTIAAPNKETGDGGDKTKYQPRMLTINNPLGFVYQDAHEDLNVGATSGWTTSKNNELAGVNGNFYNPVTRKVELKPYVRSQTGTMHGTVSPARENVIVDRSLMGAFGRQLGNCRVDFTDFSIGLGFNYEPTRLPWEEPPVFGPWNKSLDYPNINDYNGVVRVVQTGVDPSKLSVGLIGTAKVTGDTSPTTWTVGRNPMSFSINVPRFQPPNYTTENASNLAAWRTTGYTGRVRVYIDSNNNGRCDSAWERRGQNLRRIGRGSSINNTEAFREFFLQAHVLPDMRVTVAEKTIDIGQVPNGFGIVPDASGNPVSFYDNLNNNLLSWDPNVNNWGFKDWFKTFTVYNEGNVNIMNLRAYAPALYSDTVSDLYGIIGLTGAANPGERIPNAHVATSIDPVFLDDGPGIEPLGEVSPYDRQRTFQKSRVGEKERALKVPDIREDRYRTQFNEKYHRDPEENEKQQSPVISVSVPIGQPAGTYYGKFTLYNDINNNGVYDEGESIGEPVINLTLNVSESKMTAESQRGTVPHIDNDAEKNFGDMYPVAYRDQNTGNVRMLWTSNRHGEGLPTGPWYIYQAALPWDLDNGKWVFKDKSAMPYTSWWTPSSALLPFPDFPYLEADAPNSFFPQPTSAIPTLGAMGAVNMDTAYFYSPSIFTDPITKRAWASFLGRIYKSDDNEKKSLETRSYITEIVGDALSEDDVYDMDRPTQDSTRNIDGDWTTPKYGLKGLAAHMQRVDTNIDRNLFLWSFWFGGNNGKWRIFYNANIDPDGVKSSPGKNNWTNGAQLPMPSGLLTMAEPAPFYQPDVYWDPDKNEPYKDLIDVVYSGYSTFHKNSDIYLSRYQPNVEPDKKSGSLQMAGNSAWQLPMRGSEYFFDEADELWYDKAHNLDTYIPFTKLDRSPTGAIWYSNDIDWDPLAGFRIMVFTDANAGELSNWQWIELTTNDGVRDPKTGVWVYNYVKNQTLRRLFRGIIVDPAAGTIKFLRSPGKYAMVVANYTPRAYRLTTNTATDDSPFIVMDRDGNPRYRLGNPVGNPFYMTAGWDANIRPSTDRLWVFWRRPGVNKPGVGIQYNTYRYGLRLLSQVAVDDINGSVNNLTVENTGSGWPIRNPVEIDWVKNSLYFSSADEGNKVKITYTDVNDEEVEMYGTVELIEELSPSKEGSTFGNLTQLMVNEGQISAFKDRVEDASGNILEDRIWAFWTSTRSGNTDIFYETISPRFYGDDF